MCASISVKTKVQNVPKTLLSYLCTFALPRPSALTLYSHSKNIIRLRPHNKYIMSQTVYAGGRFNNSLKAGADSDSLGFLRFIEGLDRAEAREKSATLSNPKKPVGHFFPESAWTNPYITLLAHINK